jgi:hypothetical protein
MTVLLCEGLEVTGHRVFLLCYSQYHAGRTRSYARLKGPTPIYFEQDGHPHSQRASVDPGTRGRSVRLEGRLM